MAIRGISKVKKRDLLQLCNDMLIQSSYHKFYNNNNNNSILVSTNVNEDQEDNDCVLGSHKLFFLIKFQLLSISL